MKKNEKLELEIVGTIPFKTSTSETEFVVFKDGRIGELSKKAQQSGLIVFKRVIKNIDAGIRMYLIYIFKRYRTTIRKIYQTQVIFPGQIEKITKWEKEFNFSLSKLKKEIPVKELEIIIDSLEKEKEEREALIQQLIKKATGISQWTLRKAKILLEEKKRVNKILEVTFLELLKLYNSSYPNGPTKLLKDFYFSSSYLNLGNGLKTINLHFTDNPNDLETVKKLVKRLDRIKEKEGKEFVKYLEKTIDYFIPILEGPIEYQIANEKYRIKGGKVKCLK